MSSHRPARDTSSSAAISSAIMSRYQTLRRLLIKINYTSPFPPDLFLTTAPPALTLPILSHLFLAYSPHLTAHFLTSGFLVSSSAFSLQSLYALLQALFGYHPQLSQQQFSSERGYVERKLQLLCDVIGMCVTKAEELDREKGGGSGASAGKGGGVPRVAVLVKEKRNSGGADERDERKEQRRDDSREQPHRQANDSSSRRERHERQQERRVEQHDKDDDDDENDSISSPQQQQRRHQHVSFTHDDSSQPLSPSHLSPQSHNQHRSPRHLSPPPHSYQHQHSPPSPPSTHASAAAVDPLVALHQQLHRISHRTNQLSHNNSSNNSNTAVESHSAHTSQLQSTSAIERLVERFTAMEVSMREELSELRREMADMRSRLALMEERERATQQPEASKQTEAAVEESKESAERATSGGDSANAGSGLNASSAVVSVSVVPSDMSEFLTHINDRVSSTAKLLESSRRARGRPSEGTTE